MKKINIITIATFIAVLTIIFYGCKKKDALAIADSDYDYLPQDVQDSCSLIESEFKFWFKSKEITENGLVEPANSVDFPHRNNCDFYKWSEQMFLWITSPTCGRDYKSGGTVMESPVFYTVSAEDSLHNRTFTPHKPNTVLSAMSNIKQTGPHRLPIIIDKQGRAFEVEPQRKNEAVKDAKNKSVVVGAVIANANGLHSFVDTNGKAISSPKAIIDIKTNAENIVQEFKTKDNKTVFLDSNGRVVDTEQGQAGSSGALVAVNKSLVYYITMVNDVYAYFLTGVKDNNTLNGNQFPTTASARDSILAYAKKNGFATPPDPDALAIELKTSWVEVKDLPNPESYVTIKAKIPVYDKSNPKLWKLTNKTTTTTLALVGMHIVGSVAGHPEMIWATFEHQKNTPNEAYSYRDVNGKIKQVKSDGGKDWLFNVNANDTAKNTQKMTVEKNTIVITDTTIDKPNVKRVMAWGVASDTVPNPENRTPADSNSEVIAINNSIRKMLVGNDIRKNYLLIGATWTSGGAAPNGNSYPYGGNKGDAIGTGRLANSTMETFFQSPHSNSVPSAKDYKAVTSCFYCHSGGNSVRPDTLSHLFTYIIPLAINNGNVLKKK